MWPARTVAQSNVVSVQEGVAHKKISVLGKASVRRVCSFGAMSPSSIPALKQPVRVPGFVRSRSLHAEIDLKRKKRFMGVAVDNALQ